MKLFLIIAACFALPIFLSLLMALVAALAHVWRGGTAEAREFARAGIGLQQFFGASVAKQDSGSLISTRAGISLRVTDKGLLVNETRTVAKDVF